MSRGFVSDLKVLDLTQGIAGPFASKLLADQGAQVIKVEPVEGDYSRRRGPFASAAPDMESSLTFAFYNTSKKSITLDFRTPTGTDLIREMAQRSDILIEDLRPGEMSSLGLGYEELSALNPSLIVVSVTPFGQTGPYRDFAWEDITLQAISGFMYLSGNADRPPVQAVLEQAQNMGGRCTANAILLAIMERSLTGEGQHVDVSISEAVATEPPMHFTQYNFLGVVSKRSRRINVPTDGDFLPCKDGYICIASSGGNTWEELAILLDAPELLDDKYATRPSRQQNAIELFDLMVSHLKDRDKHEVFHAAMQNHFVFGVAQTPEEVLACPQLADREYFQEVSHPILGTLRYTGSGFMVDGEQCTDISPAPFLGQHNKEIYCDWLGRSNAALSRLKAAGVI